MNYEEGDSHYRALEIRLSELRLKRSSWESQFSDIRRFIRPVSAPFSQGSSLTKGEQLHNEIFDSTAPWAAEQLANGLHSYLTSSTERWFSIGLRGHRTEKLNRSERMWLEEVADTIYHYYSMPESNHTPSLHEGYLDIGAFGTMAIFQEWDDQNGLPIFHPVSMGDLFIDEGANGHIDTAFRVRVMTRRQILQEWPDSQNLEQLQKASNETQYEVIHAVYPRRDKSPGLFANKKPWASCYFCPSLKHIFSESGYDTFPYHVARWAKQTGEVFGRGPGLAVLPSVKMINAMKKELLVSAQLANSPPVVFEEDSILLPVDTDKGISLAPRSILWKTLGTEMPQPLMSGSQPQLTLEMLQAEREQITQAFYIDYLIRAKKRERQSVTEILDDRGEMLRQMAPMIGRLQTEFLGTMIARTYQLLWTHRKMPRSPATLEGRPLEIIYTSPAAKAQLGTKGSQLSAFIQDLSVWANIKPDILEGLETDEVLAILAEARDVSPRVIKDPKKRQAEQEQMQQQQQMMQMAEMGPQLGQTLKNVAEARQVDPSMAGLL